LVFEDLHWIDSETQAVLEGLVESLPTARVLLLVNYRPEYQHAWGSKTYYRQLRIDALSAASAGALLGTLLGTDSSLDELKRVLISRTEGNPFFLEESVRTLVETNALAGAAGAYRLTTAPGSLQMPATAQAVLAARIDRLEPDDKRLLQAASVIGKDVPSRLLHAIADVSDEELRRRLARLQAAEFLYESRLFPELEYTFKHALTHEVTYGGLVQGRRRELHARIVDAIETLHADRLDEHLERLAHHALRGELGQQAVHYLRQAGQKATARSALRDAQAWLEEALTVLTTLPESQTTLEQGCDIRLELRLKLVLLGELDRAREHLREAEVLAKALNDERRRGRVCAGMANILPNLGDVDEGVVSGTRALEIAARLEDSWLREIATYHLAEAHFHRGDYARAVELTSGNLAELATDLASESLGERHRRLMLAAWNRFYLLLSLAPLGRFGEASQYEAEAINLDEATYDASVIGFAYTAAGDLHSEKGEWATAASLFERAGAAFRSGNVTLLLPLTVSFSAPVLAHLGNTTEALNRLREGECLIQGLTAVPARGDAYYRLGFACLLLGKLDESQHLARRAVELLSQLLGRRAYALRLLGDIATHPDRFDAGRGEAHYLDALALAEPRGMRPLIAHCHLGLGKLYRRTGKREQAQEHLTTAQTMYREMDMRFWLEQAEAELNVLR
jgi:tetratricopeptide (TPR) repeat protein